MASSYRSLLATVKTELVEAKRASQHRIELFHALETFLPDFQAFLELSVRFLSLTIFCYRNYFNCIIVHYVFVFGFPSLQLV